MIGLTSITFRGLTSPEIINLAVKAGLDGIEWGSDVHVPQGQESLARNVAAACADVGLAVTSYGSYFRAGLAEDPTDEIRALIKSAKALGAPVIRVWAGEKSPQEADVNYRKNVEKALTLFVEMAADEGICIATEYHRHTLTENADSALALLQAVPGLKTYWQPNPDISEKENLAELQRVLPYLSNVHVFQWTSPGNVRHPLEEGTEFWSHVVRLIRLHSKAEHHFLLEFVQNDSRVQCIRDAGTLRSIVKGK